MGYINREYTIEEYKNLKDKRHCYPITFSCGHKGYVHLCGHNWRAEKDEILAGRATRKCDYCETSEYRKKLEIEKKRRDSISFTNDMLNIYKIKVYRGDLAVKNKTEESKQKAIEIIKSWYKNKPEKIDTQTLYISAKNKEDAIKKLDEYSYFWDGVECYYSYIVDYNEPIKLNIKTKFLPDESKDDIFYFIANGNKYKVEYEEWDFYHITEVETGKEYEQDNFPYEFFPVIAKSEDYDLFDLGDGYQMIWGEVPYSDMRDLLIFNKQKDYYLGWNLTKDSIGYYLEKMKANK